MNTEQLKALGLDDKAIKEITGIFDGALKGYVPKTEYNTLKSEKETLEKALKERGEQLETLKNSTGDMESLNKQITALQEANKQKDEQHAAEIKNIKITAAVENALITAKAKNIKAVKALLELEKAELDENGAVKGLDEQIKKLTGAEDSKFLFDTNTKKPIIRGARPAETGMEEPDARVDVSKMTYEELAAYMDANPDAKI